MKFSLTTSSAAALLGLAACGDAEQEPTAAQTPDVQLPESDVEVVDTQTNEPVNVEGMEATATDATTSVTARIGDDESAMADGTN